MSLVHDSDDEKDQQNIATDSFEDEDFVLVDQTQYPDGTLIVPTIRLELSKTWARRSVLIVLKFQKQVISK